MRETKYRDAILRMLATSQQPMDVEKIRVACKIGNWQTAVKHCLELLHDGKISGVKTSKSWIFWNKRARHTPLSIRLAELSGGDSGDRRE